jgi:hypothetical protein
MLLYLSCSQIWLNPLAADRHFWCCNMRKIAKKKKKKKKKKKHMFKQVSSDEWGFSFFI